MKTLIWKEWRRIRTISLGTTALFVIASLGLQLLQYLTHLHSPHDPVNLDLNAMLLVGWFCGCLSGILGASTLFCEEIGEGTLAFLAMLPIRRSTIWVAKIAAGLAGVTVTFAGVFLSSFLVLVSRHGVWAASRMSLDTLGRPATLLATVVILELTAIVLFSITLPIALFVDRTTISAIASIVACYTIPVLLGFTLTVLGFYFPTYPAFHDMVLTALLIFAPLASLAAACYVFVNGESLRTRKRFVLLGKSLVCWAAANGVIIVVMYLNSRSLHAFAKFFNS